MMLYQPDILECLHSSTPRIFAFSLCQLHPHYSAISTGGEGQYTQWVHCELIVGSETICLAHTVEVGCSKPFLVGVASVGIFIL